MSNDPDEEALTWAGDSSLDVPEHPRSAAADNAAVSEDGAVAAPTATATSSVLLVAYGVLGGIYLLYTVGWTISIIRDPFTLSNLFAEIMSQFGEFLAIAAPAVWMAVTFLVTRGRPAVVRLGWLIAGAVLLVPVPLLLGGF